MSPDLHSPRSDPGPVHDRTSGIPAPDLPTCNDERFAYKNRRKDQRKKPAFPKSGGPSILVYVKDDPRKNSNRNLYPQYGLQFPQFPVMPQVSPSQGLPYLNPSLLMHMFPPPLPPHLLQHPFPPQRQRYNSSPTLQNCSSYSSQPRQAPGFKPASNFTTNPNFSTKSNFTSTPTSVPQTTTVPCSTYPSGTNPAYGTASHTGIKNETSQFNTTTTTPLPLFHLQPYYLSAGSVPVFSQTMKPSSGQQNPPPAPSVPSAPNTNPYHPYTVTQTSSASDSRTSFEAQYSPAQTLIVPEQVDSSTQSSPHSAGKMAEPSPPHPFINPPPVYPNPLYADYKICSCADCSQISPTESISTNDSGFVDGGKSFTDFKDETKDPLTVLGGEDRPLLYCDQNNPTFSLDSASLSHVMAMASRENMERNEQLFQNEKKQIRKKIPCRNLSQTGVCHFGETCWFNHQIYNN